MGVHNKVTMVVGTVGEIILDPTSFNQNLATVLWLFPLFLTSLLKHHEIEWSWLLVMTAKYQTISIEIVGTCIYVCLACICIRHTALDFSVRVVLILRMRCVNATRCTVASNEKAWTIVGRSGRSRCTRESSSRSAPFYFSVKKI